MYAVLLGSLGRICQGKFDYVQFLPNELTLEAKPYVRKDHMKI